MKRIRLVLIFLFLALTLMACNLTSMLPGNEDEKEPALEVTEETSVDASEEESMQESEVIEEPTSEPVRDPMDNAESSTQSSGSQSACDHPYFPMRKGATWVYFDSSDVDYYHWEVESVSGDLQNATAVMHVYITEFSEPTEEQKLAATQIEYNWVCNEAKGIVSFDLATLNVSDVGDDSFTMTMNNIEGEGVMIPPADQLEPGFTWEMTLSADFSAESLMGATGSMQAKDFYTVTGNDPIEFNGQTFDGLQYQRQFENEMEIMLNGVAMALPNIDFDFQTYTIMAKGVGYIKLDSDSDIGTTGLQLIRYNIP
ncbi:MAG: hypothetical protein IH585_02290 [Anaerolineaceae bacterium]|nr:hypothetical protein [Anaerolineaceae bacterium]